MSLRTELALALLLAAAVTVAVVAGRRSGTQAPSALEFRASAFLSGPQGSKAVYEVLARLGQPVERRRRPLFDLTRDARRRPALLVVLAPPLPLLPAELEQVAQFVRSGGAVLAAGLGGGLASCVGWRPERAGRRFDDSLVVAAPAPGLSLPPVASVLSPRAGAEPAEAKPAEDDPCAALVPVGADTLLRALDRRPVALRLRYAGGGHVTLVADVGYFRNRVWRSTDAPYVVAPLLIPPPGRGRVSWDEYHQRFGREGSLTGATVRWLATTPAGWAMLQLVVVALVGLAVSAVRFGPARSVIERRRRSPLEHVEALAAGLEGAGGVDTAVALTVSGLRRRLSRAGQPATGDQRQWVAALELVLTTPRGREAVRRLQQTLTQPGGAERVLAAAQAVEDVWEELRPRKTRGAS